MFATESKYLLVIFVTTIELTSRLGIGTALPTSPFINRDGAELYGVTNENLHSTKRHAWQYAQQSWGHPGVTQQHHQGSQYPHGRSRVVPAPRGGSVGEQVQRGPSNTMEERRWDDPIVLREMVPSQERSTSNSRNEQSQWGQTGQVEPLWRRDRDEHATRRPAKVEQQHWEIPIVRSESEQPRNRQASWPMQRPEQPSTSDASQFQRAWVRPANGQQSWGHSGGNVQQPMENSNVQRQWGNTRDGRSSQAISEGTGHNTLGASSNQVERQQTRVGGRQPYHQVEMGRRQELYAPVNTQQPRGGSNNGPQEHILTGGPYRQEGYRSGEPRLDRPVGESVQRYGSTNELQRPTYGSYGSHPHDDVSNGNPLQRGGRSVDGAVGRPSEVPQSRSGPTHGAETGDRQAHWPQGEEGGVRGPQTGEQQPGRGPQIERGPPRETQPERGPQRETQPERGPPRETQPERGPARETQPERGPTRGTQPERGPTFGTQPERGPPRETQPERAPTRGTQPERGPTFGTQPEVGPTSGPGTGGPTHGPHTGGEPTYEPPVDPDGGPDCPEGDSTESYIEPSIHIFIDDGSIWRRPAYHQPYWYGPFSGYSESHYDTSVEYDAEMIPEESQESGMYAESIFYG
ncbi:unnamed protein product [Orchesella dallaii]|uniref:Uncharacterized protein n=1 Tax=Orchesella dallaii TaxID=48710 RepID=A0ABP1RZ43_9HEXA